MGFITIKRDSEQLHIHNIRVKILQKINEHARAYIKGMLYFGVGNSYLESTTSESQFTIEYVEDLNEKPDTIFNGLCRNIITASESINIDNVYRVEIELVSFSYLMDIKKMNRSFQNESLSYGEVISAVNENSNAVMHSDSSTDVLTEKFIIQYSETDWAFVKRMASRLNEPLLVDCLYNKPQYKLGVVGNKKFGNIENYKYSVTRDISAFRDAAENEYFQSVSELDYLQFQVWIEDEKPQDFSIGDTMTYDNKQIYIEKSELEVKDNRFLATYYLKLKNGLRPIPLYNESLHGLSLVGKVIDVADDLVKVHLVDIDDEQPLSEACWFRYATMYSTWYCMPEKGDFVHLYFPNNREEKAVALNSIKTDPATDFVHA